MHVRLGVELPHAGVHKRDACGTLAPFLPPLIVLFPLHVVELEVLGQVHGRMGRDDCYLAVKFAEDDLADPGSYACISLVEVFVVVPLLRDGKCLAHADDSGRKIRRQSAGRIQRRHGTILGVTSDLLVKKLVHSLDACIMPGRPELANTLLVFLALELFAFG